MKSTALAAKAFFRFGAAFCGKIADATMHTHKRLRCMQPLARRRRTEKLR